MIQKIGLTLTGLAIAAVGLTVGLRVAAKTETNTPTSTATKTEAVMNAEEQKLAKAFTLKFEDATVKSVKKTPFNDLYEVVLENNEIIYTNASTEYVMVGNLLSSEDKRDLTQERKDQLSKIDFNTLPLDQAFHLVKGNGKRKIVLFEDPNCGYCKRFRHSLEDVKDITVYTYIVDILGDDSTAKAKALLCTADPAKAFDDWMLRGIKPGKTVACDTSVLDKNKALAIQLGITGTPTIFLENGDRLPGAVDRQTLETALAAIYANN